MRHKMTRGPCEVCPDCDGHKRVICSCVPGACEITDVDELVGAVGCPECDGDGDHWCPTCCGTGAIPCRDACTCNENCGDPCPVCNRPVVQAARAAYRMGRKDARRYAAQSIGEAHVDSQTVERFAQMLLSTEHGDSTMFEDLKHRMQIKYKIIVQEMLSTVGAALLRSLDEAASDPVDFEAIARAAEMRVSAHNEMDRRHS